MSSSRLRPIVVLPLTALVLLLAAIAAPPEVLRVVALAPLVIAAGALPSVASARGAYVVLGVAAAVVTVGAVAALGSLRDLEESSGETAHVILADVRTALDLHYVKRAEYPATLEGLTLGPRPILERVPRDPWGGALRYRLFDDGRFEVCSLGPDRRADTTDDLCAGGRARARPPPPPTVEKDLPEATPFR